MSKIEELQKRIEQLEAEVELLKGLVMLQNKWIVPTDSPTPLSPYYPKPTIQPPYKITCGGKE